MTEMTKSFDVFLSHNSRDKPAVREFAKALKSMGLLVWLDEEQLVPGRPWQEALEEIIKSVRTAAVLIGKDGLGPWENPEMRACLSEFVKRSLPVIPVLLPQAPSRVDLPLFLQSFTWVDCREGFDDENIARVIWGITGHRPGEPRILSPTPGKPAYRTSTVRPRLEDVFKTVGLPKLTYVEPNIYRKFSHAVRIPGKHIVLEGPSGVGKTCLVYRVLEELGYIRGSNFTYISARAREAWDRIPSILMKCREPGHRKLTVIDDFHILPSDTRREIADQMKVISDGIFEDEGVSKCVLIGIPTASAGLLYDAVDLGPRLTTFRLGSATNDQLDKLIREGEERLSVRFRDRDEIVEESNGSFYLCQFICHAICFAENILEGQDDLVILRYRIEDVRKELVQELNDRYSQHLLRFCKGTSWKVEKKSGYLAVLASITRTPKSVIHLNEVLLSSGSYSDAVSDVLGSIHTVLNSENNGQALSRLLHYDPSIETFSIEDAVFRYYLNKLDIREFLETLGLHDDDFLSQFSAPQTPIFASDAEPLKRKPTINIDAKKRRDVVFVSYSHADAEWMERLRIHLKPFVQHGILSMWSDTQIRAGSNWKEEIDHAIAVARVAVLLVSADYLASDFIVEQELPLFLAKSHDEGMVIIWVPISHCAWELTSISKYQAAHDPKVPLAMLSFADQEKVLLSVSMKIKNALSL